MKRYVVEFKMELEQPEYQIFESFADEEKADKQAKVLSMMSRKVRVHDSEIDTYKEFK